MTIDQALDELTEALRRAIGEHGTPNTFGLTELWQEYGGPRPQLAGKACRFKNLLGQSLGIDPVLIEYLPKAKGYKAAALSFKEQA